LKFIGRKQEIELIKEDLEADRASLQVIYGRRRIGKTELILNALTNRRSIYFQAEAVTDRVNQQDFKNVIKKSIKPDHGALLDSIQGWENIFEILRRESRGEELTVVLDEFPYLCQNEPGLPSILQKIWDEIQRNEESLNLILCGSLVSFMESLLNEKNALYGRQSLQLKVEPLPVRDAVQFFEGWSATKQLYGYGVFGGVPYYPSLCDSDKSLKENLCSLVLKKGAVLYEEPLRLLDAELNNVNRYSSALRAIAAGQTRWGDILNRIADVESGQLGHYLGRLEELDLICRVQSLHKKGKNKRYYLKDPFFRFWFRFIAPNMSALQGGAIKETYRDAIAPHLDDHMGWEFERIAQNWLKYYGTEIFGTAPKELGQIWTGDYDIDIAGRLLNGEEFYGECKWWSSSVGKNVLTDLEDKIVETAYSKETVRKHRLIFSKTGFTEELIKIQKSDPTLHLLEPEDLV